MSEVVPLPSFGEVFFDERGQERVLRVTWHEGTLVLSLWRGEMCSASFRMPMQDVGRLVDTLDEGFVEAGGQYPDEMDEQHPVAGHQEHGEFPGTGQYARPRPEDYAHQYPDPAGPISAEPQEPRQVAALGPNDVLVARGVVPPLDRSQDYAAAGYGPADAVPRENMIVGDSLPYGQPQPVEPLGSGSGEPLYQLPGDPYASQQPDPYGVSPQQDRYAAPPPSQQPDPYGAPVSRQQPADPFTSHVDQFPAPAHQPHPDPYGAPGQSHSTDPFGFAAQQQPAYGTPQSDAYGYPPAAQPDPYAFGAQRPVQQPSHQAGHPADLRDLYGASPAYEQDVDPSDPLGLRGQQPEQRMSRPYVQDAPHSTGERLRPEQHYDQHYDDQRYDDRDERRGW
ncbi:hypothetical protein [Streptosporangium sp. NPDC087985]|uniref:hypothetical protein n=1 Tax=Streptosporangium sp. NPDC087985 TaxID=3366196 RepID=UPI00380CBB4F